MEKLSEEKQVVLFDMAYQPNWVDDIKRSEGETGALYIPFTGFRLFTLDNCS